MFCTNCGNQVDDSVKFCGNCGEQVVPQSNAHAQATSNQPDTPSASQPIINVDALKQKASEGKSWVEGKLTDAKPLVGSLANKLSKKLESVGQTLSETTHNAEDKQHETYTPPQQPPEVEQTPQAAHTPALQSAVEHAQHSSYPQPPMAPPPAAPEPPPIAPPITPPSPPEKSKDFFGKGVSRWALILGVGSLVLSWVPVLGILIAVAGLVLGFLEYRKAKESGASAKILSIILSAAGFVLSIILTIAILGSGRNNNNPTPVAALPDTPIATPDNSPKALTPISSENLQDYDYIEISQLFTDAGFTNVSTTEVFDIDPDTDDSIFINTISIGGTEVFQNAQEFRAEAEVRIVCHRPYEKYTLSINVEFVANLLFSKYDVDLLINDEHRETLAHGTGAEFEFRLRKGDYSLTFAKSDEQSISGSVDVKIESDTMVAYKIACYNDEIAIDDITAIFDLDDKVVRILQRTYSIGDKIKIGTYIENYFESGPKYTDISWTVIDVDEESQKILILCDKIIDGQPYNTNSLGDTWYSSSIREWLNSDFIDTAFSDSEQSIIADTYLSSDEDSTDKVFLLTRAQAQKQQYSETAPNATHHAFRQGVVCYTTHSSRARSYSYADGDSYSSGSSRACWWLMDGDYINQRREYINIAGGFEKIHGVRPAMWLNLSTG